MPDEPIKHDVDMEAYDAEMEAAGFEFVDGDGDEEPVTELTFLVELETPARTREVT